MDWVIVGTLVGLLVLVGLVVVVVARRDRETREEADPLFIAGIGLSGAGAALVATVWPAAVALFALGMVLLVVGIVRMRRRQGGS